MPTGHDLSGDGCHLFRCFPETKYHFRKALAELAVVIDTGKAQVLECRRIDEVENLLSRLSRNKECRLRLGPAIAGAQPRW